MIHDAAVPNPPALISVVDDDESVRDGLALLLGASGFSVDTFASAEAFIESGADERTDCLILDIAMPRGMSGPDLERELLGRGRVIPIVFITAHADELERSAYLAHGASALLLKPFSEDALLRAVRSALRR